MYRLLSLFSVFFFWFSLYTTAQPLQFLDVSDSSNFKEINTHYYRPDSGKINIALTDDSAFIVCKFDHCGRLIYTSKFAAETYTFSQMYSSVDPKNPNSYYFITTIHDSTHQGIFCSKINLTSSQSSSQFNKIMPVSGSKIIDNPFMSHNDNLRFISYNESEDSINFTAHLFKSDDLLQQQINIKLLNNNSIRSHIINERDELIVAVDQNLIYCFDEDLNLKYAVRLDSSFSHFDKGLMPSGENEVAILGSYELNGKKGIVIIKLDTIGRITNQTSEYFEYDDRTLPEGKAILDQGNLPYEYLVSFGLQKGNSSSLAFIRYYSDLSIRNASEHRTSALKDYIVGLSSDYSESEEIVFNSGILYEDTAFNKIYCNYNLANDLRINGEGPTCGDKELTPISKIPTIKRDTFLNAMPINESSLLNNSNIRSKRQTIKLARECSYFDFKGGASVQRGCVGDIKALTVQPILYSSIDLNNPFIKFKWSTGSEEPDTTSIIPHAPVSVVTKYCDEEVELTYNLQEIDCIDLANVFIPASSEEVNKEYYPIYKMDNFDKITSIDFRIYNRWGKELFKTNKVDGKWNGQIGGKPAPMDSYIYWLKVNYKIGEVRNYKGTFTIIR